MATRYWVGGTGSWSNNNTHWSATSGGAGGATFPTLADDVIFDANSGVGNFTVTVNPNQQPSIRNFTMTNCTGAITGNPASNINVYGTTFTLDPTGTFDPVNTPLVTFLGSVGCNITCSSQTMGNVTFSGGNAAIYNFLDDFHTYDHSTVVTVNSGTINANGHNVLIGSWRHATTGLKTINMGSGLWSISGNGLSGSTNPYIWQLDQYTTLNKGTANIILTSTTNDLRTFAGAAGKTFVYNQLTIGNTTNNGQLTFEGSSTFSALNSIVVASNNILFQANSVFTFGAFNIAGTAGNLVFIASTSTAQTTLVKSTAGDYWYVGANSIDNGNNTNLAFTAGSFTDYVDIGGVLGLPALPPPPPASSGNFFMLIK